MNGEHKKLVVSAIAGILLASLIVMSLSVTTAPYKPLALSTTSPEPKFLRAIVGFTNFSTINLTVIEKYGGEIFDTQFMDFIAAVQAKIPRENITKLAEEDIIKWISYDGITMLYGESEPIWNVTVEAISGQLKLTMRLEKTVFQIGEDVKVKFALTNISEENVTLCMGGKRFDFAIHNSTNSEIHRWSNRVGFALGFHLTTLKPGENITYPPLKWEQIYDIFNASVKYNFLPVSAGTYYIIGEEYLSYSVTKIQTPPTEITILQT